MIAKIMTEIVRQNIYIQTLLISVIINLTFFVIANVQKTDKFTDITYALTFIIISWYLFLICTSPPITLIKILPAIMITMWGIRLGAYLLIRIRKIGKDKRFDGIRENFFKFLQFWVLQAISVWVIMLATTAFYDKSFTNGSSQIQTGANVVNFQLVELLYFLGTGIWLTGLIIETLSDYQKYTFINNSKNKNKWIASGLWKYSRYPNYFGEMLCWWGIFIFTLPHLQWKSEIIATISPIYITLLLRYVSGIPILEKKTDEKWGEDPNYQDYKKNTRLLLPLPTKNK